MIYKIAIGTVTAAGISLSSWGAYSLLREVQIQEYLKKDEVPFKLPEDKEAIKKLVGDYKTKQTSTPSPIEDLKLDTSDDADHEKGIAKLLDKCEKMLKEKANSLTKEQIDQKLTKIKAWCLKSSPI